MHGHIYHHKLNDQNSISELRLQLILLACVSTHLYCRLHSFSVGTRFFLFSTYGCRCTCYLCGFQLIGTCTSTIRSRTNTYLSFYWHAWRWCAVAGRAYPKSIAQIIWSEASLSLNQSTTDRSSVGHASCPRNIHPFWIFRMAKTDR